MSQHTPGPWKVRSYEIWTGTSQQGYVRQWEVFSDEQVITQQLSEANARLIAAAPEMLTTIKTLLNIMPTFPRDGTLEGIVQTARTLLATVEGKK